MARLSRIIRIVIQLLVALILFKVIRKYYINSQRNLHSSQGYQGHIDPTEYIKLREHYLEMALDHTVNNNNTGVTTTDYFDRVYWDEYDYDTDKPKKVYDSHDYANLTNTYNIQQIQFLENYRNPCWYENYHYGKNKTRKRLRCLPYFFIAGIEKCGTTDLYHSVVMHPSVAQPEGKECNFFGQDQWTGSTFGRSYLRWFDYAVDEIQHDYDGFGNGTFHSKITVDGSVNTLLNQIPWRKFKKEVETSNANTQFSTAMQIKRLLPSAKFIVILRNPIERLYSSYLANLQDQVGQNNSDVYNSINPQDFHKRVIMSIQFYTNCTKTYGEYSKRCTFYNTGQTAQAVFNSKLQAGLYALILEDWFEHFPKDQFKIVRLEDYTVDKYKVVSDIYDFLGMEQMTLSRFELLDRMEIAKNNIQIRTEKGPMLPDTYSMLKEFYRSFNDKLAQLLSNDQFLHYNS